MITWIPGIVGKSRTIRTEQMGGRSSKAMDIPVIGSNASHSVRRKRPEIVRY